MCRQLQDCRTAASPSAHEYADQKTFRSSQSTVNSLRILGEPDVETEHPASWSVTHSTESSINLNLWELLEFWLCGTAALLSCVHLYCSVVLVLFTPDQRAILVLFQMHHGCYRLNMLARGFFVSVRLEGAACCLQC